MNVHDFVRNILSIFLPTTYLEIFLRLMGYVFLNPIDIIAENRFVKRISNYFSKTIVGKLFIKYFQIDANNILSELDNRSSKYKFDFRLDASERLLLAGRRYDYAKLLAPKEKFPTHYMDVPEDLKRDITSDGRTLSNPNHESNPSQKYSTCPAVRMAGKSVTEDLIEKSWRNAASAQMRITVGVILIGFFLTLSSTGIALKNIQLWVKTTDPVTVTVKNKIDSQRLASSFEDIWSDEQAVKLTKEIRVFDNSEAYSTWIGSIFSGLTKGILVFILFVLATLGIAHSVGRLMFIAYLRDRVYKAANKAIQPLRHAEREALQRWRDRLSGRQIEYDNHCRNVHFVTEVDRSPLIDIGMSLGNFEFKGHLLAKQKGQQIRISINDLSTHLSILGGTGEGKSRSFFNPFVRQLLQYRKDGYPIALYITDDKGAIYLDILKVCDELDIPKNDVVVIGTNPTDFKVDILDGLSPFEMTDLMASIASQAGGGESGNSFWPQLGSDLILQIATILVAFEKTETGTKWMINNNMRAYSLINILRVAQSDEAIEDVLKVVLDALSNRNEQYIYIQHLDNIGLRSACDFLVGQFLGMVDATKVGIIVNVRAALRSFAFKPEIADGFGTGVSENIISATEISGNKIKLINVSQIEHGSAGRMVCIALKTLLFKQARAAQQRNPEFADERLKWWLNPVLTPDSGKYCINVFVADEYQSLITASESDGLSDSSVWNVLRSAGVYGVVVSQSLSAYRLVVGDKAVDNFVNNFRGRIYLRTEDTPTLEVISQLVGKTQRFQVNEWAHYEGTVAAQREHGVSTENVKADWSEEYNGTNISNNFGSMLFNEITFSEYHDLYSEDRRFISISDRSLKDDQASAWRQEDKRLGAFQQGSSRENVFDPVELMEAGKGCGVVILPRGLGTVVDMVQFNAK